MGVFQPGVRQRGQRAFFLKEGRLVDAPAVQHIALQRIQQAFHTCCVHAAAPAGHTPHQHVPCPQHGGHHATPEALLSGVQQIFSPLFREFCQRFFHDDGPGRAVAARVLAVAPRRFGNQRVLHAAESQPEIVEQIPALALVKGGAQAVMHKRFVRPDFHGALGTCQILGNQPDVARRRVIHAFHGRSGKLFAQAGGEFVLRGDKFRMSHASRCPRVERRDVSLHGPERGRSMARAFLPGRQELPGGRGGGLLPSAASQRRQRPVPGGKGARSVPVVVGHKAVTLRGQGAQNA